MNLKILYPVIDGEITGGNIICLRIIEEALNRGYGVVVNSPAKGRFTQILEQMGIRVYNINVRHTFRLDSALRLAFIIKKEGVNLVHSHTPLSGTFLSRLAGCIAGVAVINHMHNPDFINLNPIIGRCQSLLIWFTSRFFCNRIIAVSKFIKREIVKQGSDANKITVIYNGIDSGNVECKNTPEKIRRELGLSQNQRIIAEVARLGNDKGQHILIQAAPLVLVKFPEVVFMLVGEYLVKAKEYKKELETLIDKLGLKQKIIFTGYRPDIADLMNAFDLFVLPSIFVEGLPVVILEAMRAKKAVIVTTVGGMPEIVIDGETGTLIPPEDPGKLAEAIIYHLDNPEISGRIAESGHELVKQKFSLTEMLDKTMHIYQEIMKTQ